MLDLALQNELREWQVDLSRLDAAADYVAQVTRNRFPALDPPMHSRWRHFVFGGRDLWEEHASKVSWPNAAARARAEFDLAIVSVLLDAGAGPAWKYHDAATNTVATRSEGLALASLRWFMAGGLSSDPHEPLRVDAASLARLDKHALHTAFQVSDANPLVGAEQRAALLNRLGSAMQSHPHKFGADGSAATGSVRPGNLFDLLAARAPQQRLPAAQILEALLDSCGPIWQNRPALDGVPLGDCWPHPALEASAAGGDIAGRYAALHKLSQWLSYSLIEPLQRAGLEVQSLQELTGLAEYRNGGLFTDMGVLVARDSSALSRSHSVAESFVIGWRSITVALLDRLAPLVGDRLGLPNDSFLLARVLEGGTWAAGRQLAREKRGDGSPPFQIQSDGTVL